MHSLVDSKTHYLYDIIFDPGKNYKELVAPEKERTFAYQIVINLVDNLPRNGFTLFFDSWYSSINLGKELTKKGFNFVTTLRSNACGLPDKNLLANSSKHYAYDNNNKCIIHQFEDKKTINFFTNILQ